MDIVQPGGNVRSVGTFGNAPARLQWLFKNGRIFLFLSSGMSMVVHIIKIIEEKLSIDRSISTFLMIGAKLIKEKLNDYNYSHSVF